MTIPPRRQGATASWSSGDDRLRLLLDGMRDLAVVMLGPQGMVLTWNSGAVRIFGHLAEEIIGQQVATFYPPAAAGAGLPQQHLDHALDRGRFEEKAWRVRKDGSRFWASVGITPLRDRSGRLRGFGQVVRDLSDRLRADDLLAVLDASPDAVLGVDGEGRVLFVNVTAARLFGYPRSDITGRPVEVLVPVDLRDRHASWRAAAATPADGAQAGAAGGSAGDSSRGPDGGSDGVDPAAHREGRRAPGSGERLRVEGLRGDGTTFPAEVVLRPVPTPRGRIVSVTVRDLTPARVVPPRTPGVPVQLPPDPRPEADLRRPDLTAPDPDLT